MPWKSTSFKSMIVDTVKVLAIYLFSKRVNGCQRNGFFECGRINRHH